VNERGRITRAAIVTTVTVIYMGGVFQAGSRAFWTAGLGDWLDPYFINSLLEWWYYALLRVQNPASPPVFHPVEGTLGYSHGLILFAPFYVPLRLVLHPFQAYNLAILLVVVTGSVCLYAWLRRALGLGALEAFVLTAFFAASPNVLNGGLNTWTQRASVYLVPPILLIGAGAVSASGTRRAVLGFAAGLLALLLYTQDFYSGHFTFFFAGVWILPRLVTAGFGRGRQIFASTRGRPAARLALVITALAAAWSLLVLLSGGGTIHLAGARIRSTDPLRPALLALVALTVLAWMRGGVALPKVPPVPGWARACAAGALIGVSIFLLIYLPVYRAFGGFAEEDYLRVLRQRPLSALAAPWTFIRTHEGFDSLRSFLLLPFALAVGWFSTRRERVISPVTVVVWLLVALLVFLIPFRFDGLSAWGHLFRPLPGFNSIRDPLRIAYQFELAVVLGVGLVLSRMPAGTWMRAAVPLAAALLMLLFPNSTVMQFNRPNADYDRWVAPPIEVDRSCRSFYMRAAPLDYVARSPEPWTLYSNDAAFIALRLGIPTLHGVSAWTPPEWRVRHPHADDFVFGVRDWTARYALTGLCGLDIARRTMTPGLP
jgi:hypothetical protein